MGCRAGWDPSVSLPALVGRLSPTRCQPAGRTGAELRPGIPPAVAWIFASLSPFLPHSPHPPLLSLFISQPLEHGLKRQTILPSHLIAS